MEELSVFRIFTGVVSVLAITFLLNLFSKRRIKGLEFLWWLFFLVSIFLLSIFPQILKVMFNFLNLSSNTRYDRLIQLGYLFSFLLLSLVFYYRSKIALYREQFIKTTQVPVAKNFVLKNSHLVGARELIIVIPAYNEQENIGEVISRIPKRICGLEPTVVVVSDGSEDETYSEAQNAGALVMEHPISLGQCVAYRTGYLVADLLKSKYLIHLDADGQYKPEEIELLLKPIINDDFDLVSGSRTLGYYEEEFDKSNFVRRVGVVFFNFILSSLLRKKITDSASGFRAIKVEFLPQLTLKQEQFHSSELLIESIKAGARFSEVPVSFLKRISGESKKPNSLKYGWGFASAIIRTWIRN